MKKTTSQHLTDEQRQDQMEQFDNVFPPTEAQVRQWQHENGVLPAAGSPTRPAIGDVHWSWTGTEWIDCAIDEITKSGKSFYCSNVKRGYGSHRAIPMSEYQPKPEHNQPLAQPKPIPLFG